MGDSINFISPTLTVVMPVYNGGKYLEFAIRSILTQTYSDFEFIIINDGSTDGSAEIIAGFALLDSRIIHLDQQNRGLVYSLNLGIKLSKGKFIARMDCDDISHPYRFERQLELLETLKIDICGCHYLNISKSGKKLSSTLCPLSSESILLHLGTGYVPFAHGSAIFRSSIIKESSLYYTEDILAEDYDLWIRLYKQGAIFSNVDEILFSYRVHGTSISNNNNAALNKSSRLLSRQFTSERIIDVKKAINSIWDQELTDIEEQLLVVSLIRLLKNEFTLSNLKLLFKGYKRAPNRAKIIVFIKLMFGRV